MKKARKIISMIVTACFLLTLVPVGAFAAPADDSSLPFDDVQATDWFHEPVQYVYDNGLMAGTGERIFDPQVTTTRGMIATILHRMAGSPDAEGAQAFSDVDADAWYAEAVNWASENGVISGYGGGLFGPTDPITREQMASMLYRYAAFQSYDVSAVGALDDFADAGDVSDWATDVMQWAVGAGLLAGRDNNQLAPQGLTTRAEAAAILMRYCENIVGTTTDKPGDEPSEEPSDETDAPSTTPENPSTDTPSVDPTPDDPSEDNPSDEPSTEPEPGEPVTDPDGPGTVVEPEEPNDQESEENFESFEEAYKDFIEQNISDFSEDRVLQFDETDTEDNFAVVNDDVVIVRDNDEDNQLSKPQGEESGEYLIENVSSPISDLKNGSKLLMLGNTPEESAAIIIESIKFEGSTAIISSDNVEIDDFFRYIQLDKQIMVDQSYLDTSTITEGVSYNGTLEDETSAQTIRNLLNGQSNTKLKNTFSYFVDETNADGDGSVADDDMIDIDQNLSATHAFSIDYAGETAEIEGNVAI